MLLSVEPLFPKDVLPAFPHDTTVPSANTALALSYPAAICFTFFKVSFPFGAKTGTACV